MPLRSNAPPPLNNTRRVDDANPKSASKPTPNHQDEPVKVNPNGGLRAIFRNLLSKNGPQFTSFIPSAPPAEDTVNEKSRAIKGSIGYPTFEHSTATEPLNIIILGTSFGGLSCAHHFLDYTVKQMKNPAHKYRLILIGPSTHIYWNIGAPRALVAPGHIKHDDAFIPIEPGFYRHQDADFKIIQAKCIEMNATEKNVTISCLTSEARSRAFDVMPFEAKRHFAETTGNTRSELPEIQTLSYHALLICTGTSANSPLLSLHGPHLETSNALETFHQKLATAKSVMVVGGGTSGVEVAGQMATLLNRRSKSQLLKSRLLFRKDAPAQKTITLLTGGDKLLSEFAGHEIGKPEMCLEAEQMLTSLGVHVVHGKRVLKHEDLFDYKLKGQTRVTLNDANHTKILVDAYVDCTGVKPNSDFAPHGIKDKRGDISTPHVPYPADDDDKIPASHRDDTGAPLKRYDMRVPSAGPLVYAVGDVASYSKNYVLDVYGAIPVVMANLHNDLRIWEFQEASPYDANGDEIAALRAQDEFYVERKKDSQLCPVTRWGGVGVLTGAKLPKIMVHALKGHDYRVCKARFVVVDGGNPYAVPVTSDKYN